MKANELRIGSLIYWNIPQKQGVPHEVIGILGKTLHTVPISIPESMDEYLPIPLTPEILEKCGFVKRIWFDCNSHSFGLLNMHYDSRWWFNYADGANVSSVQYLHQLQNLIFALTNTELTVSL